MDSTFPNPILRSSEGMALEKTAQWQNQSDFLIHSAARMAPTSEIKVLGGQKYIGQISKDMHQDTHESSPFSFHFYSQTEIKI